MLKRYSIPEIMPEKTLKDKVDAARINLASITHVSHFDVKNVFEALTALEEKVKELEKERRKLWSTINELMDGKEAPTDGK